MRTDQTAVVALVAALLAAAWQSGVTQDQPKLETTVFARAIQPGEVVRLDVSCTCGGARPTATAFGTQIALFPMGEGEWRGLIGIDVETKPAVYTVTVTANPLDQPPLITTRALRVAAKRFPVQRLQVADRFVNPPANDVERIRREADLMEEVFATLTPRLWDGPFVRPVAEPTARDFGAHSVFNGQPRSPHGGVDFGSPAGTAVAASGGGRIALAEALFFTGNTVIVDHGLGLYSVLAHLSAFTVAKGDRVQRGTIVGLVGATGRVTGPHLHWGIRLNKARVDPLSLLVATGAPPP